VEYEPFQPFLRFWPLAILAEGGSLPSTFVSTLLEILDPPCGNQEALYAYAEKLNSIHTPGWSFLLKVLAQIYLGYADPSYVAIVKRGILRTIDKCSGDNLSIYYFALSAIDRAKPLCR
jgi:hypothetical protein